MKKKYIKQVISLLLTIMLVLSPLASVHAEDSSTASSSGKVQTESVKDEVKEKEKSETGKSESQKEESDKQKKSEEKTEASKKTEKTEAKKEETKESDKSEDKKESDKQKSDNQDNDKEENSKADNKKADSDIEDTSDQSKTDSDLPEEDKTEAHNDTISDDSAATQEDKAAEDSKGTSQEQTVNSGKAVSGAGKKEKKNAVNNFNFDNSTDIADGIYDSDQFTFSFTGGTGKATMTCGRVIVENGKASAVLEASSENMIHIFTGTPASSDEDTSLYNPANNTVGKNVYVIKNQKVTIPVKINAESKVGIRTTAMSVPHWVTYTYKITIDKNKVSGGEQSGTDNVTSLENGTYKPDSFTFTGGSGKATVTCDEVTVNNNRATAVFTVSSENMTHIYMGQAPSTAETPALYDSASNTCGANVYPIAGLKVTVPVKLNVQSPCSIRTTAMSSPHWVNYNYEIVVSSTSQSTSPSKESSSGGSSSGSTAGKDTQTSDAELIAAASSSGKLANGTYKVKSTTDRKMFYLYPKDTNPAWSILVVDGNKMTATITLTGDGYDYVYMGTPAQAKKAAKSSWIKGTVVNGYYTFTIPVSDLNKKLPITPHSKKYEEDGDPSTEPWRPDKWIIFYSAGAVKIKDGTTSTAASAKKKKKTSSKKTSNKTSGKQTKFKNDNKKDKVSKWSDDSSKSTSAVNSSTTLKDGVYTPDSFSWSGGSGRLSYIRCNKITVTGGKAYATIEFGSSKYDMLRANGRVYSKNGGGNSTFVIPVKLNANNTIIGRTTAMSQPHWVKYTIYIGKAETKEAAKKAEQAKKEAAEAKVKLTEKAPEIPGLSSDSAQSEVVNANYFKLYDYDQDVKLLSIDLASDTGLEEEYKKNAQDALEKSQSEDDVEYDEEGNIIARSSFEWVEELYHNNVVNYLLVPEEYDVPAGLDKEYIIIRVPSEKTYMASQSGISYMEKLGVLDHIALTGIDKDEIESEQLKKSLEDGKISFGGSSEDPDYSAVLKTKTDLAVVSSAMLPEQDLTETKDSDEKTASEDKQEALEKLERRFTALGIPVLVDRSDQEEDELARAEWIKVYGALFNCSDQASSVYDQLSK